MGGGLELAVACDMRIASSRAILGFAEANLVLFPGTGGTQRVTRLIGLARAKEMVLTGQIVMPDKALEWGLINAVAEPEAFNEKVAEMARALADRGSLGQGIAKRVMYCGSQTDQQTAVIYEGANFPPVVLSEEASEGITAMVYRRKPEF
jgi:enoyl-CoA hydratase/carnithine racemase